MLETRGICVHIGGVRALDGIDFSLDFGELHCLIGPNGAGKSTFFRCLTGQLRPSMGEAIVDGRAINGWKPFEIARLGVGIKTQVPSVFDGLSVRENIWVAARRTNGAQKADRIARAMTDRFGLGDLAGRLVGGLAHGERQRAELASVMASSPRLLLLDEPSAGMSSDESEGFARYITDMRGDLSVIVVEHDMGFIQAMGSMVTVFHQGKVLTRGSCEQVLADEQVRSVYLGREDG